MDSENKVSPFPSVEVKKIVAQFRAVLGGAGYHKLIIMLQSAIRFELPPKTICMSTCSMRRTSSNTCIGEGAAVGSKSEKSSSSKNASNLLFLLILLPARYQVEDVEDQLSPDTKEVMLSESRSKVVVGGKLLFRFFDRPTACRSEI